MKKYKNKSQNLDKLILKLKLKIDSSSEDTNSFSIRSKAEKKVLGKRKHTQSGESQNSSKASKEPQISNTISSNEDYLQRSILFL